MGSQLTAFATNTAADLRGVISNCLLLAQLAADKAAGSPQDVTRWYDTYVAVLRGTGWIMGDLEFRDQAVGDAHQAVHKAIIPAVTAMLGPAAAALPTVLSVLNGLQNIAADSPWIALFDRHNQHGRGAKFQVAAVDSDAQGQPEISLSCLDIEATRTVTQVLFFKFSDDAARLRTASARLTTSPNLLEVSKAEIAARVNAFIPDFIKNIRI